MISGLAWEPFRHGEDQQVSSAVHKPGGSEKAALVFDYDPDRSVIL